MVSVNEEIKSLRAEIDRLDQEILKILKQRIRFTEKIGKIKKTNSSDILDKQRESEILSNLLTALHIVVRGCTNFFRNSLSKT